ncbi:MAG: hypothetical protein HY079_10315 [Elusimicrobia bacterium]|nr:hypothetical protein [Elusimicrobiota bacterium]
MKTGLLLAAALALPASAAAPARAPEDAVAAVLRRMRATLRYAPDAPAPRGPHEWTGRRALTAGTVNGCVESAKAFQTLLRAEAPGVRARLIDSFDAAAEGGHAVVEVTGSDGTPFLVDAASFDRLPGAPHVSDEELARPVDIRPEAKGRIYQFPGKADAFAEKVPGGYRLSEYPYGAAFSGTPRRRDFADRAALERALSEYAPPDAADFRWARDHGLILSYDGPDRTGFLYAGANGTSRHVVYSCRDEEPVTDAVTDLEPAARARYAREGKGGCGRPAR